jgi:cyclohexanone monooxygenase
VRDPKVADMLTPSNLFGCKRLCVDTGYWATFNRPNVTLVDINPTPIDAICPEGLVVGGRTYALDALVFATGFDAMTGSLLKIDIRGRNGLSLADKWRDGPRAYLGLAMAGFPNLFTITGPGSPSVLTNMLPSIEQHVEWIVDCIVHVGRSGRRHVEVDLAAEEAWVFHCNDIADHSLRGACNSWYSGANIAGKPRVFMPYIGGFPAYVRKCEEVVANGYQGFALS